VKPAPRVGMSKSVRELQRHAILKMLDLGQAQPWKIFLYDKFCQDVVAPLLKVWGLRNLGVTIQSLVEQARSPLDVPAVYFLEPTEESVRHLCDDIEKNLYECYYVNFSSSVPHCMLKELAAATLRANASQKVAGVMDRHVSFVSLDSGLFSLNLPSAYHDLHSPSVGEGDIVRFVERIVDGLLSVCITMQVLPIIRCQRGDVSERVSRRLEDASVSC